MFDIGFWELLVIGVMALVILGPERLPGALRSTMKVVRSVKQTATGFKSEVEEQLRIHELHENLKKAENQGLTGLNPELQKSVDELKAAAASVQQPYKKDN
ncbi:MAG: Sec-independent protein translocase protein TatB [Glaciecola sp. HTCC2999]|jgi:sec-independent protein translocase protein TatB|nr:MAG: Sec-independent protein translocase protein TatB [Glaciecola sp. HTCC2999]